jgi:hypothetical protein
MYVDVAMCVCVCACACACVCVCVCVCVYHFHDPHSKVNVTHKCNGFLARELMLQILNFCKHFDFVALLHVVKVKHISDVLCTVGGALVIICQIAIICYILINCYIHFR